MMRLATAVFVLMFTLFAGCSDASPTNTSRSVSDAEWSMLPMPQLIGKYYDPMLLGYIASADANTLSSGDLAVAGYALYMGIGVQKDIPRGIALVTNSCEQGHLRGCALQGFFSLHARSDELQLEAVPVLTPACDAGNMWACSSLVAAYTYGIGVEVDSARATTFANRACEHPGEQLCKEAATILLQVNKPVSLRLHKKSCDADNAAACRNLAANYEQGTFGEVDGTVIRQLFDKSCLLGHRDACWIYLRYFVSGKAEKTDPTYYVETSDQLCRDGVKSACNALRMFFTAPGAIKTFKNEVRAYEYAAMACELEELYSCLFLGEWSRDGIGTEPNPKAAIAAYRRACQSGDQWYASKACPRLAELEARYMPSGDPSDLPARSCELGSAQDCRELAWMYATGDDVAANPILAIEYFKAGCELDDAMSCLDVAALHHWAEYGVEKNLDVALTYYKKSCELDFEFGCEQLAEFYQNAG